MNMKKGRFLIMAILILFFVDSITFQTNAQVTVGEDTAPNSSAVLDIRSKDHYGLLLPRLALASINDAAVLAGGVHVAGMFVYNTATAGTPPGNVTPGIYYNDGTHWVRVDSTSFAQPWLLTGNALTDRTINFIGTTDSVDLVFRVNNQRAGYLSAANNSGGNFTSFGLHALRSNVIGSGVYNSAFGYAALADNTTGTANSGFGYGALAMNVGGRHNSAFGVNALVLGNALSGNTGIGAEAGKSLAGNSSDNTAVGHGAMEGRDINNGGVSGTAVGNTAIGVGAIGSFATGILRNTAVGYQALHGASGGSLYFLGNDNVAVGYLALGALGNTVNSNGNIAIGSLAGSGLSYGSNNIFIGYNAQAPTANDANYKLNIGNAIIGDSIGTANPGKARIGIATDVNRAPYTTLEVQSAAAFPDKPDGIMVPKLTKTQLQSKDNSYGTNQNGTLVFVQQINTTASTPKTISVNRVGFYYYDATDSQWKKLRSDPEWFYLPPFKLPWSSGALNQQVNLYNVYVNNFTGMTTPPAYTSPGAPGILPGHPGTQATDFYYVITDYSTPSLAPNTISIDANGLMEYDCTTTPPTPFDFITIILIRK
jgi:hypothetical protein